MTDASGRAFGIAIIGGGGAFGRFIASALPLLVRVELRAIAGTNVERTQRAARDLGGVRWTVQYQELFDDLEIDLVVIASPPHLHSAMGRAAAEHGKAIFIEKPAATTLADGLALLAAVDRSGVAASIDYVMRFSPLYATAAELVQREIFGPLRRIEFRNDAGDEGLAADHWFWDRARSGGIFVEHGVHFFDVYGWIAGSPPTEVHGMSSRRQPDGEEDVVHADVRYASGVLGSFTHAFDKPSRLESQQGLLVCDRGYLTITGWTPVRLVAEGLLNEAQAARLEQFGPSHLDILARFDGAERAMRGRGRPFEATRQVRAVWEPTEDSQELYRRAVAGALGDLVAVLCDPRHRQRVTLADGLLSLAVACAAAGTATPDELKRVVDAVRSRDSRA